MFLRPLKIDAATLALMSGLPSHYLRELLAGREMLDHRAATRLGEALGTGPEFWIELESEFEVNERAQHALGNSGVVQFLFGERHKENG